jgi:hypothetical protein
MFAKMQLVHPGLYEQAREVVYGMIQEQSPPSPPKPKPAPKPKKKPQIHYYPDTLTSTDLFSSNSSKYTWKILENLGTK